MTTGVTGEQDSGEGEAKPRLDALAAITADLDRTQRTRRAHFLPALLLSFIVVVASLVIFSVRPDLLDQPAPQLGVQALMWVLCLGVFPAIGVGLLFPGRIARMVLALAAVAGVCATTTGFPFGVHGAHGTGGVDHCMTVVIAAGALMMGIGFLSGAFIQRRSVTSVYWVAAGLTLAALNLVTWHCPESGLMHVLPSHVGGASLLLLLAVVIGTLAHRRARTAG